MFNQTFSNGKGVIKCTRFYYPKLAVEITKEKKGNKSYQSSMQHAYWLVSNVTTKYHQTVSSSIRVTESTRFNNSVLQGEWTKKLREQELLFLYVTCHLNLSNMKYYQPIS